MIGCLFEGERKAIIRSIIGSIKFEKEDITKEELKDKSDYELIEKWNSIQERKLESLEKIHSN